MLELTCRSKNGQFEYKVQHETHVGLVEQIVEIQGLFERNNQCGLCKSDDVFWNIRASKDKKKGRYFEKKCGKCHAALAYHLYTDDVKKGGLYTKEFDAKDGSAKADKWAKYVKPVDDVSETKKNGSK